MVITAGRMIFVLFILIILDFSSDSIMRTFPYDVSLIIVLSQVTIGVVMAIFLVFFGLKIPRKLTYLTPFIIVLGVIIFGFMHGILSNNARHAINEVIPYLFFVSFLGFAGMKNPISTPDIEKFLMIFVYIMTFKMIIYSILSYGFYDNFSWKVLVKQSPLLLIPLSVYLSKISLKMATFKTHYLLILVLFCIMLAMARMLYLGVIFLLLAYFLNRRIIRSWVVFLVIALLFMVYSFIMDWQLSKLFGFFYGGEIYQGGWSHRMIQLGIILDRLQEHPFLGVGFGYYTPGYDDYGLLGKPYLLELDIQNFISKIGLIATFVYTLAYIKLYRLILKLADDEVRRMGIALFLALLTLVIYGFGQTMHQSYIYWTYLAFVYGFVVSHLRAQAQSSIPKLDLPLTR
jgi:hypothetical protein